jgi:dTDP-4-dehydrorhamnose reductase
MKVLLLGHKGMLGNDLLLQLKNHHEITGLDREEIDITSASACKKAIDEIAPEIVINAAAYTDVDGCESNKDACMAVNAEAVKNIAAACRGRSISIVHFSTDYVFDGMGKEPYNEEHACAPISAYGFSKLAGERYLQAQSENYLLIRTAWLYGKNGKNFVKTILQKAETTNKLEVVEDQIGSPTYTKDLAAAVELLIDGGFKGVFHLTNRGVCSWFQFAVRILQEAGVRGVDVIPIKSEKLTRPAKRPFYSALSNQKFVRATGKTMQPWQLALQDYLRK